VFVVEHELSPQLLYCSASWITLALALAQWALRCLPNSPHLLRARVTSAAHRASLEPSVLEAGPRSVPNGPVVASGATFSLKVHHIPLILAPGRLSMCVCVCARACRLPMWALLPFSHPPALYCNIPGSRATLPARRSTAGTSVRDVDCRPCPPGSWDADSLPTTACEDCASGSSYSTVDGNRCVTVCAADESELTQPTKFEDRK